MGKIQIEDQDLASQVRNYLDAHGVTVAEDAPMFVQLPGASKVPQLCESGSGLMTSGGRFFPGYDAKLKSALHKIAIGKPDKIPVELTVAGGAPVGPMGIAVEDWTPESAVAELNRRGWPVPTPKPVKAPKEPKAEGEETGQTKASRRRIKKGQEAEAGADERAGETDLTEEQLAEANANV